LKLIAHADPAVCDIQDEEMKTPLHIACDNSCVLFEEDHDEYDGADLPPPPPCHMSVKTLLACSLRPVTLQDAEGKIPLQHAVASNAIPETIQLFQSVVNWLLGEHSIHSWSTAEPTVSPRKRLRRTISFH
jgi:ankyrin repeat protein